MSGARGTFNSILINIATPLSLASIAVGINTYVDVQLLKKAQEDQGYNIKAAQEILNRIDKTQAVQDQVILTLSKVVDKIEGGSK